MSVLSTLNQLEAWDLVRPVRDPSLASAPEAYTIKHALVQDTAQESLLKNERKRLNLLVAQSVENLYADRIDEYASRLFQYYDSAGWDEKTIEYAVRAGKVATRVYAKKEAIAAYRRAFELASKQKVSVPPLGELMICLGRAYEIDADYDAALVTYRSTRDLARERQDRALELTALVQLAKVLAVAAMRYDPEESQRTAGDALALARELGDKQAEARLLWTLMLVNLYGAGGARRGVQYGEQALALARELDLREQMAYTLNDLFYTYMNLGEMARARAASLEARALWRELDNMSMLTDALTASGMDHLLHGEFELALARANEGRSISMRIGNAWGEATSFMIEGYAFTELGAIARACDAFETCMRVGDPIGMNGPTVMARYELARMFAFLGDVSRGRAFAHRALEQTRRQQLDWDAWAFATLASVEEFCGDWDAAEEALDRIGDAPPEYYFERMLPSGAYQVVSAQVRRALRRGDVTAAQERLDLLMGRLRRSEFFIFVPGALNLEARAAILRGEFAHAATLLDKALREADRMDLRVTSLQIAITLVELARAKQDVAAVETARRAARSRRDALLPHLPSEWCETFLQTPFARQIEP